MEYDEAAAAAAEGGVEGGEGGDGGEGGEVKKSSNYNQQKGLVDFQPFNREHFQKVRVASVCLSYLSPLSVTSIPSLLHSSFSFPCSLSEQLILS